MSSYVYSEKKRIVCNDTGEICNGKNYLMTKHWKQLRAKVYEYYNGECQRCKSVIPVQLSNVHHRTYKRIGHENITDLILYCKNCHTKIHSNKKELKTTNQKLTKYIKELSENEKKAVIEFIERKYYGKGFSKYDGRCTSRIATEEERIKYGII